MNSLNKEIEYVHTHNRSKKLVRPLSVMFDIVCRATTTYTNLSLFWNDYVINEEFSQDVKYGAFNDLYLLALLHIDEQQWRVVCKYYKEELENGDN